MSFLPKSIQIYIDYIMLCIKYLYIYAKYLLKYNLEHIIGIYTFFHYYYYYDLLCKKKRETSKRAKHYIGI